MPWPNNNNNLDPNLQDPKFTVQNTWLKIKEVYDDCVVYDLSSYLPQISLSKKNALKQYPP